MYRKKYFLLLGFTALFSVSSSITKTNIDITKNSVDIHFRNAVYNNLIYLQKSSELCVNYEEYKIEFSSYLSTLNNIEIVKTEITQSPNYIYPIYVDAIYENILYKTGIISHQFRLSCELRRS